MSQSVQGRSGESFTPQNLGPVLKRQVRGHDQAEYLIRRADHIKQQFRSHFAGGDIAQFIQDQQVQSRELFLQLQQCPFFTGFQQLREGTFRGEKIQARRSRPAVAGFAGLANNMSRRIS